MGLVEGIIFLKILLKFLFILKIMVFIKKQKQKRLLNKFWKVKKKKQHFYLQELKVWKNKITKKNPKKLDIAEFHGAGRD